MKRNFQLSLYGVIFLLSLFTHIKEAKACHALAVQDFQLQSYGGGVQVRGYSQLVTWGCDEYWLDIEVRCANDPYDAAPFNPGYWGPLNTYPYFQSAQMHKTSSQKKAYSWTSIPFSSLCPGSTYRVRARENHNGLVGPWTNSLTFTVPGTPSPLVATATSSKNIVCIGQPVTLTTNVIGGCGSTATYTWNNGAGSGEQVTVTPPSGTQTYTVTVHDPCSKQTTTASVTVQALASQDAGTPKVTASTGATSTSSLDICKGVSTSINTTGSSGTLQWQSGNSSSGPWTNIPGATSTTYNIGVLNSTKCYRVVATGCNNGKAYSSGVCVNVHNLPTANFNFTQQCEKSPTSFTNNSTVSGGNISSNSWNFGDGGVSSSSNPNHTYNIDNTYSVTLTVTSNKGCQKTVTKPITIHPKPTADFSLPSSCSSTSVSFQNTSNANGGTISGWNWNFGDGNASSSQNGSNLYSSAGSYNVSLTATSNNGCSDTKTKTVAISEKPVANFTASDSCQSIPSNFTDQSSIQNGSISSWDWYFGDGGSSSQQSPNYIYSQAGNYTATLIVTSTAGCKDTTHMPISILHDPVPNFIAPTTCEKAGVQLQNISNIPAPSSITSWAWDLSGGNSSTLKEPITTFTNAGTYTITLTASASTGCVQSISKTININETPNAIFSSNGTCSQSGIGFQNTSFIDGNAPLNYSWDFSDGNTSQVFEPTHTFAANGSYQVQLIATSPDGCKDTTINPISITAKPQAIFTPKDHCSNLFSVFKDQSTIASGTINQWHWKFGDGNTSNTQNDSTIIANAGNYSATLIVTSAAGCKDTISKPYTIFDRTNPDFTFADQCTNHSVTFTNTSTGNNTSSFTWLLGDGSFNTNDNTQHTYTQEGHFTIQLISKTNKNCKDTTTQTLTIHPEPIADFSFNGICNLNPTSFTNNSTITTGTISDYLWDFNDGNTSNTENPLNIFSSYGFYDVSLEITSAFGCKDSIRKNIEIFEKPSMNFSSIDSCSNITAIFSNSTTTQQDSIISWSWDFDDGNSSNIKNPSNLYATHGNFNVTLVATTNNGCKDTLTQTITRFPTPLANFAFSTPCLHYPVEPNDLASIASPESIQTFQWEFEAGNLSSLQQPSYLYPTFGDYAIKQTVTGSNGCIDDTTISFTIYNTDTTRYFSICADDSIFLQGNHQNQAGTYLDTINASNGCDSIITSELEIRPLPIPSISSDLQEVIAGQATQIITSGGDGYTFDYHPSLSCLLCPDPQAMPIETTTYNVDVELDGCHAWTTITIAYKDSVFIPEGFSPNGDGTNDFLVIKGLENYPDHKLIIFNRWGNTLFTGQPYRNNWAGTSEYGTTLIGKGNKLPPGAYFYHLFLREDLKTFTGFIQLVN